MVELHPTIYGGSDKFLQLLQLTAKLQHQESIKTLEKAQKDLETAGKLLERDPFKSLDRMRRVYKLALVAGNAVKKYGRTAKILNALQEPPIGFLNEDS